jgi:hypothetical protein
MKLALCDAGGKGRRSAYRPVPGVLERCPELKPNLFQTADPERAALRPDANAGRLRLRL